MARLYEYVPSSDNDGYFLLGSSGGQNTTIQVRTLGNRVFDHLDYEAGRRGASGHRGEKLPRELVDWMWNARLLHTGSGEDSADVTLQSVLDFDGDSVEFSESDIEHLVEFVQTHDVGEGVDLRAELVDILGSESVKQYEETIAETEDDGPKSKGQLSSDERAELAAHLANTFDQDADTVSLDDHLPRANSPRDWLSSVRDFLNDSDAFVHRAAIGSEGDPVYNMQTGDIEWDLYDLRHSERDSADCLVIINPLSGHSPKQSFRVEGSEVVDWQSYEGYLGIRQVRELISVVPSVRRTLRSVPGFDDVASFPQPSSNPMLAAQSIVNQSLLAAKEPFDVEPAKPKIWGEVVDVSPKGWVEIRLQTNRAVVVSVEKFAEDPSIDDWVLLEAAYYSEGSPTDFDVITVG